MDSFLSAVHHFTGIRILRVADHPVDAATLAWAPLVGLLAAVLCISFFLPLAAFYLPPDIAVIPTFAAISWLRGFKAETGFCDLCDTVMHQRKRGLRGMVPQIPGVICLIWSLLFKYAIVRQFFLLESVRLLAFGTFVPYVSPLLRSEKSGWIKIAGLFWLSISAIIVFSPVKLASGIQFVLWLRGPALTFALVWLSIRLSYRLADDPCLINAAALPAELAAYLCFILVRYHFL